jgi:hypothetical protein
LFIYLLRDTAAADDSAGIRQASGFFLQGRQRETQGNNWTIAESYDDPIENYRGWMFGPLVPSLPKTNEMLRDIHQLSI